MSQQWWFCLTHKRAELEPDVTGADLLGPYPDEASASAALSTVEQRNESWDNDPRWSDDREA